MEKIVPQLYKEYGDYTNKRKMIPNMYDGCIPVWRRLLLGVHTMARNEFRKTQAILGFVMMKWHPHADAVKPAATLVQNEFLFGQGNWGNRLGVDETNPAAPRYTELKSNPLIEEMVFKYINSVPWEPEEFEPEPIFLPTMIPLCLFAKYGGIGYMGFGFKTVIPNYHLRDLIKRTLWLKDPKNNRKPTMKPRIEGCDILSSKKELEQLMTTGEGTIKIKGWLHKDPKNFRIYLRGWDNTTSFQTIFKKMDRSGLISNGDVSFLDESTEDENCYQGTNIRFEVNKARNRNDIYKAMEKSLEESVVSNMNYKVYVYDPKTDSIEEPSIDQMLIQTYNIYKNVIIRSLNEQLENTKNNIKELKAIDLIKKHIGKALVLNNEDKIVNELHSKTKLEVTTIKSIIEKYKIKKLLTVNTDIRSLKTKVIEINKNLKDIDSYTKEHYTTMMKGL